MRADPVERIARRAKCVHLLLRARADVDVRPFPDGDLVGQRAVQEELSAKERVDGLLDPGARVQGAEIHRPYEAFASHACRVAGRGEMKERGGGDDLALERRVRPRPGRLGLDEPLVRPADRGIRAHRVREVAVEVLHGDGRRAVLW